MEERLVEILHEFSQKILGTTAEPPTEGLRLWLLGHTVSADGSQRVKPFQKLTLAMLPTKELKNAYKLIWKPIFGFLEDVISLQNGSTQTEEDIKDAYTRCLQHLQYTVSYCFEKKEKPRGPMDYCNLACKGCTIIQIIHLIHRKEENREQQVKITTSK